MHETKQIISTTHTHTAEPGIHAYHRKDVAARAAALLFYEDVLYCTLVLYVDHQFIIVVIVVTIIMMAIIIREVQPISSHIAEAGWGG